MYVRGAQGLAVVYFPGCFAGLGVLSCPQCSSVLRGAGSPGQGAHPLASLSRWCPQSCPSFPAHFPRGTHTDLSRLRPCFVQLRKPFPRAKHRPLAWSQSCSTVFTRAPPSSELLCPVCDGIRAQGPSRAPGCPAWCVLALIEPWSVATKFSSFYQRSPVVLVASVAEVLPQQQVFKLHIIYEPFLGVI